MECRRLAALKQGDVGLNQMTAHSQFLTKLAASGCATNVRRPLARSLRGAHR